MRSELQRRVDTERAWADLHDLEVDASEAVEAYQLLSEIAEMVRGWHYTPLVELPEALAKLEERLKRW